MVPVESSSPCLVRFLSEHGVYPSPNYGTKAATWALASSMALAAPFLAVGNSTLGFAAFAAGAVGAIVLGVRGERNLPANARRHRAAHKVRERMKTMMTLRTLHRVMDQGLLDLIDEGARQYLLSRGHASKVQHALTAQADAAAIAAMDNLLLEVGLCLPQKAPARTFGDAMTDAFAPRSYGNFNGLGIQLGRFFGATPPPEPDFETMRRVRPHVQALADLACEIERTLPSLVQTMEVPGGEPPITQTLAALREHREGREQLERELRLGG